MLSGHSTGRIWSWSVELGAVVVVVEFVIESVAWGSSVVSDSALGVVSLLSVVKVVILEVVVVVVVVEFAMESVVWGSSVVSDSPLGVVSLLSVIKVVEL